MVEMGVVKHKRIGSVAIEGMSGLLNGDRALVTGAGRGIGRGIAFELASHGCEISINDIDEESVEETATDINSKHGVQTTTCIGDVTDIVDVERCIDETVDTLGGIDILVNNAGIVSPQSFEEIDSETWQQVLDVNITGVKNCTAEAFPELKDSDNGRIVNIASIAGTRISPFGGAHYTSSKWGVIGLTKHIAYEASEYGIRANAVCPGPTVTPNTDRLASDEDYRESVREEIPLGRWGSTEDVGKATVLFASDLAEYITGTVLPVDGGFTIL